MIDGKRLLTDLRPLVRRLQADMLERSRDDGELGARLRNEWQRAHERDRTAQAFEDWRDDALAQAAVMWILACVFVRFLEDNDLVSPPRLAGPGERLRLARDQHTLYFQQHPLESDREYLHHVFGTVAALPGAGPLFDRRHNPVWTIGISGDEAAALIAFWQRVDHETGALVHDFTDPEWSTRFLGDLYQELSESARKKYALLQTPDFVLQFILDRTLTPAIDEFGFREVTLIDPACGSGHFLLAAFERLFRQWSQHEPGTNPRELAQRALRQVAGVDLNPFAVAIARFRLLLAALRASGVTRLADAPAFSIDVAAGDSLLHGPRPDGEGELQMYLDPAQDPIAHVYETEDADDLRSILGRRYHVVVGNPPYITPKDRALNMAYRDRFGSCHRQYSLAVPFSERFFDLARPASAESAERAGHVGMITANSFMKREFGKKLVETYFPRWDLSHVIDTSGAYIPGHGTPTVILLGRRRAPVDVAIRAVLGIRGEPSTPEDAAHGLVWSAIREQVDRPGSTGDFVSVTDAPRDSFHRHPWSIGGGGAAELKEALESSADVTLQDMCSEIGFGAVTREDEVFRVGRPPALRHGIDAGHIKPLVAGEEIRDWATVEPVEAIWPYDAATLVSAESNAVSRFLWSWKTQLSSRVAYGQSQIERGLRWFEYSMFFRDRYRTPLSIAFAFVATHNHFVLDRGGKVFNRSAPVIKLPADASEDDHLRLLGLLNSSTACFWMKQTAQTKGSSGIGRGIYDEKWEFFYEFTAGGVAKLPVPGEHKDLVEATRLIDATATSATLETGRAIQAPLHDAGRQAEDFSKTRETMIALQEELDWKCYRLFSVCAAPDVVSPKSPPRIGLGERAFEILMARKIAVGKLKTAWFERHSSTPITEIPSHWPEWYRHVVERRIEEIESNPQVALIEQPEYKRRWNVEPWESQVERALRTWLLDRLESPEYWPEVAVTSVARLADRARQDREFMRVASRYRGQDTFDVGALVAELADDEAVPFLPTQRYRPSGLRKREAWERTWALQRQEDAIDARVALPEGHAERLSADEAAALKQREVGTIPVPPKYKSSDFLKGTYWRLRGKLDVPKERFISYPGCERDADPTPVIGWAGWDHLQQARALATYYVQMKESEGWTAERLTPLLAGLLELLPWLKQWHNEIDREYGVGMGDYFEGFVQEEMRGLRVALGDPGDRAHNVGTPRGRGRGRGPHPESQAQPGPEVD